MYKSKIQLLLELRDEPLERIAWFCEIVNEEPLNEVHVTYSRDLRVTLTQLKQVDLAILQRAMDVLNLEESGADEEERAEEEYEAEENVDEEDEADGEGDEEGDEDEDEEEEMDE